MKMYWVIWVHVRDTMLPLYNTSDCGLYCARQSHITDYTHTVHIDTSPLCVPPTPICDPGGVGGYIIVLFYHYQTPHPRTLGYIAVHRTTLPYTTLYYTTLYYPILPYTTVYLIFSFFINFLFEWYSIYCHSCI